MFHERITRRPGVATTVVAAVCLLWTAPLGAQSSTPMDGTSVSTLGSELRAEAQQHAEATGKFLRAADRLVRRVGELPVADLESARCLEMAGYLYHHRGRLGQARRALSRAGLIAYHAGDPTLSVQMFLTAAHVAKEDGNEREAWRHADQAGFVIRTAGFTPLETRQLLARVTYEDTPYFVPGQEPGTRVAEGEERP